MKASLQRLQAAVTSWQERDEFIRPVATLVSGTGAAYFLTYAARPVLTRLFTAEAFGLLTFFTALTAVIATVASGRYGDALMLPETRTRAVNVLTLAGGLAAVTAGLTALCLPWRAEIARWFDQPELAPWLLLLPPAILAAAWMQLAETWYTRQNRFRIISGGRFVRSSVTAGSQIVGGLFALGAGALIGGHVVGSVLAALLLAAYIGYQHYGTFRLSVRWKLLVRLAGRYSRFVRYSTPAALLNNAIARLPVLLLLYFFSSDIVGYFGVTYGTLAVPLGLVTGAIGQVFFVRAAEARQEHRLPQVTADIHRRLVALGMFPTVAAVAAGPKLFGFVFGAEWTTAGVFAQYLAPWIYLASIASPLTRLFDVLERQRADLIFSVVMFVGLGSTLIIGGLWGTAHQTILWFGIVGAVLRLAHITQLLILTKAPLAIIPRHLARYLLFSVPFLAFVVPVNYFLGSAATFGITVLVGIGYLALVAWDDIVRASSEA